LTEATIIAEQRHAAVGRSNIFPGLKYRDALAAMDWLERVLGFERLVVYMGPGGGVAHAELSFRGNGIIMLGTEGEGQYPVVSPQTAGMPTQGIYIYLTDVDALYQRALAAGAEVTRPIEDTDYGAREFGVRDPEGHLWDFGNYDPFVNQH
jgi:uncharacterized glyoxalase superfamily protein PhnB